jgi:hypothetical protein
MSGYYTDTRRAMDGKSMTFTYNTTSNGVTTPQKVINVKRSDAHNMPLKDSVYSFRSNRDDLKESLQYMLSGEEFDPLHQHDTGHEFWSTKHYVKNMALYGKQHFSGGPQQTAGSSYYMDYSGPIGLFYINGPLDNSSPLARKFVADQNIALPTPNLIPYGTKAIRLASPTRSSASLAVALSELLRDGLPAIPGLGLKKMKSFKNLHQNVGGEYLNYIFGWVPLANDVRQILTAIVNARKIINQYTRDSDLVVRRRYAFPDSVSDDLIVEDDFRGKVWCTPGLQLYEASGNASWGVLSQNAASPLSVVFSTSGKVGLSLATRTTVKTWFSGAYRYHLGNGTDLFSKLDTAGQLAARLLGSRVDPLTMWQAMPWSWLLDWFGNVGDIIANGTAASYDNQLLQYGYLMQSTTVESTISTNAPVAVQQLGGKLTNVGNLTTTFVSQRKDRIRATPYGFGLNPSSFSAQQWAIIGALGMSKAPRTLH